MPVETMSSIEFENERVIDLCASPDLAVQTKDEEQEEHQEIATIDLQDVARLRPNSSIRTVKMVRSVDDTLDAKDRPSCKKHAIAKDAPREIGSFGSLFPKFANGHFVIASLKVSSVQIFDSDDLMVQDLALHKPRLVHFIGHVSLRWAGFNGFVVFFVDLAKRGSIE